MPDDLDKPYFTMNNLPVRFDSIDKNATMFLGYMDAISMIVPGFKRLATAAENFDDFKKKVIDYANEHLEFRNRIYYLMHEADEAERDRFLPEELKPL
jgi:hypothetical protein